MIFSDFEIIAWSFLRRAFFRPSCSGSAWELLCLIYIRALETWVAEVLVAYWASDPWFLPLRCYSNTQIRGHSHIWDSPTPKCTAPLLILYPSRPEFLTSLIWIINICERTLYMGWGMRRETPACNNRINGRFISLVFDALCLILRRKSSQITQLHAATLGSKIEEEKIIASGAEFFSQRYMK